MEFTTMLGMLGEGFLVTLQLFFVTLIGALPLGVLVALGRMSRFRPISYLFRLYISIMRGTPLMLQLMFIFFAPYYIFGVAALYGLEVRCLRGRLHHELFGLFR